VIGQYRELGELGERCGVSQSVQVYRRTHAARPIAALPNAGAALAAYDEVHRSKAAPALHIS
jgi:hypothetical protein